MIYEVKQVAKRERPNFLPKHAGSLFMVFENLVFNTAENFSNTYKGGFWEFKEGQAKAENELEAISEKDNSFFFLVPDGEQFQVSNINNHFEGVLTGEAYGIAITLISLSNYLFFVDTKRKQANVENAKALSKQQGYLNDAFYTLRSYAQTMPEAKLINQFMD